ncbi:MAG: cell division protein ZapE [Rhizobiales bacterium]|nr:cell division protein ZapE [Hyphomicrobiales bacterium]
MGLVDGVRQRIETGALKADPGQLRVVEALGSLSEALKPAGGNGFLARLAGRKNGAPRGLYIHGPVGRGKTMLMDLFFEAAPAAPKKRIHFHGFMQEVHARLHAARRTSSDAIAPVAAAIANEAKLLCLDEMQVTDIADAMIVGRLFEAMLAAGTVIVTTSNLPPSELYRDGLNRQLFLPFVRLIERRLDVIALDGMTDYRLGRIKAHETFLTPLTAANAARLQDLWERLTDGKKGEPAILDVLGRKLVVPEAAHGCARFSFAELIEAPLGPPDYLAIARNYSTLFVTGIPAIKANQRNEAKRFVLLIDTLYDAGTRLAATSAKEPEAIHGGGPHKFEFARTASRLREMQSASWWGKKIVET